RVGAPVALLARVEMAVAARRRGRDGGAARAGAGAAPRAGIVGRAIALLVGRQDAVAAAGERCIGADETERQRAAPAGAPPPATVAAHAERGHLETRERRAEWQIGDERPFVKAPPASAARQAERVRHAGVE